MSGLMSESEARAYDNYDYHRPEPITVRSSKSATHVYRYIDGRMLCVKEGCDCPDTLAREVTEES